MVTTYSISDLAQEFDLTTRAIRFYEDMGLLQPQRAGAGGRSRVYSPRDRTRLKLTLRAKRLGLSLVEAKEIINSYDSPRDTAPQLRKFLVVLTEHRSRLEAQLVQSLGGHLVRLLARPAQPRRRQTTPHQQLPLCLPAQIRLRRHRRRTGGRLQRPRHARRRDPGR